MSVSYDCIVTKRNLKTKTRILLAMVIFLTLMTGYLYVKNAQVERKVQFLTNRINALTDIVTEKNTALDIEK